LHFLGDASQIYKGYIAIDDVRLILDSCPATQFCDFELPNICNYEHDVTGNFKWARNRGTTSNTTGPQYDHTYQTEEGYYMYIRTRPQKLG
jgi:hypothetical protein